MQYAAITEQQWWERRQRYAQAGIRDVWLLGDRFRRQLNPRKDEWDRARLAGAAIALGRLHAQIATSRHPLLVIDPIEQQVGLATGMDVDHMLRGDYRNPYAGLAQLAGPHPDPAADGRDPREGRAVGINMRGADEATLTWHSLDGLPAPGGVIAPPGLREQLRGEQQAGPLQKEHDRHADVLRAAARVWRPERRRLEVVHGPLPSVLEHEADVYSSVLGFNVPAQ